MKVCQGEDPDALNHIEIGQFRVEGLNNKPAGNPIVVGLSLDLDGMLEVTARKKVSGLQRSIAIGNAMARFEQDPLDAARSRVQALFGEDIEAGGAAFNADGGADAADAGPTALPAPGIDARRLAVQARALVEKAGRPLEMAGARIGACLIDAGAQPAGGAGAAIFGAGALRNARSLASATTHRAALLAATLQRLGCDTLPA